LGEVRAKVVFGKVVFYTGDEERCDVFVGWWENILWLWRESGC
jgi:hypothetical protein